MPRWRRKTAVQIPMKLSGRNHEENWVAQTRRDVISSFRRFGVFKGYKDVVPGRPLDPFWGSEWKSGDDLVFVQCAYEEGRMLAVLVIARLDAPIAWRNPKAPPGELIDFAVAYKRELAAEKRRAA